MSLSLLVRKKWPSIHHAKAWIIVSNIVWVGTVENVEKEFLQPFFFAALDVLKIQNIPLWMSSSWQWSDDVPS